MITGPRYKRARRLGADLYTKTQSAKFAVRAGKGIVKGYGRSEFGLQLKEKQRAREKRREEGQPVMAGVLAPINAQAVPQEDGLVAHRPERHGEVPQPAHDVRRAA